MTDARQRERTYDRIDRELLGRLPRRHRGALLEHLRSDLESRAYYDDAIAAFRELEGGADVSELELEMVERWLFEALPEVEPAPERSWWAALLGLATVAAALVLIWRWVPSASNPDEFGIKGPGVDRGFAFDVVCGPAAKPTEAAVRPSYVRPCGLDEVMSFAYRAQPSSATGWLTLFGVDHRGEVRYYAPTPVDETGIAVEPGGWRSAGVSVELDVNHRAGRVRVFGLLAPRVATLDEVDAWATELARTGGPIEGAEPWHRRVRRAVAMPICSPYGICRSVELALDLEHSEQDSP